jgi:hypothetical protein
MNTFALELWDDEAGKCRFYTVRWDGLELNETDKFFKKYYAIKEYKEVTQELLSFVLESIGEDHGAIDALFNRFENEVVGLPNKGRVTVGEVVFLYPNFPLRLYALRINNRSDVVVLFNGGIKSAQTNQMSKDLHFKWVEACRFAKRIEEAIRNKEISVDSKGRIISADDGNDIYL